MKKNRLIGLLLALVMLVSVCTPASILADESEPVRETAAETVAAEAEAASATIPIREAAIAIILRFFMMFPPFEIIIESYIIRSQDWI